MADSFFQQIFEEGKGGSAAPKAGPPPKTPGPKAPESGAKKPSPGEPQSSANAEVLKRLVELERQLSQEKERALTYEIRFKEMQHAQSAVEDLFEKTWSKQSKGRLEEELRLAREKSQARVEILEKRLDDFQKSLLEMVRDYGIKTSRVKDELEAELRFDLEKKIEGAVKRIPAPDQVQDWQKAAAARLTETIDAALKNIEARLTSRAASFESLAASLRERLAEVEKVWHYLANDVKALSATTAATKGMVESMETGLMAKVRMELAGQMSRAAQQMEQATQAVWAKELKGAKETLINEVRSSLEFQNNKAISDRVLEAQKAVLNMGEAVREAKASIYQERDYLRKETDSLWSQVRAANQTLAHLEETMGMVLRMVEGLKK